MVRNVEDDCFSTYDQGKSRTAKDVFNILSIQNSNGVSAIVTKYLSFKLGKTIMAKEGSKSGTANSKNFISKQDILNEYRRMPELYQDIYNKSRALNRQLNLYSVSEIGAIIAFLMFNMYYDADYIYCFFNKLFTAEDSSNKTIALLRTKIIKDKISVRTMSAEYKQMLFIKTWNAYIKGIEIKNLNWNKEKEGRLTFK